MLEGLESNRSDKHPTTFVSSLGGFSRSVYKSIYSLQGLLRAIQPLDIQVFEGSQFEEFEQVGEGASYRVRRCGHRPSKQIVAMKRVRLTTDSAGLDVFQNRVACVLRDIEVMSHPPLAESQHILGLQGYGWRLGRESIPFLITDYAQYGTLREFLLAHRSLLLGSERMQLCKDICSGLEELHLAGVAHGDLKLDNVLVFATDVDANSSQKVPIKVKLADFGYSLLLYPEDQNGEEQKYNGTELYNAPELSERTQIDWENIDFRKCDIWALGLTCWEITLDGSPYYQESRVRNFLASISRQTSHTSEVRAWSTDDSKKASSEDVTHNLRAVQESLTSLIEDFAKTRLRSIIPGKLPRELLHALWKGSMKADPRERVGNVGLLSLEFGANTNLFDTRRQLADTATKLSEWTFENFQPTRLMNIPYTAKEQMFRDFKYAASMRGKTDDASKASFQTALAYYLGFGVKQDLGEFGKWIRESANQGLGVATSVLAWHERQASTHQSESEAISSYQALFKDCVRYTGSFSESRDHDVSSQVDMTQLPQNWFMLSAQDIKEAVQKLNNRNGGYTWSASEYQTSRFLDAQLPLILPGTALLNAVAAGSVTAIECLIELGANPFEEHAIGKLNRTTPIELAISLHLCEIVKTFARNFVENTATYQGSDRQVAPKQGIANEHPLSASQIMQALSASSPFHRYLIHGQHTSTAQNLMINYLLYEAGPFKLEGRSPGEFMPGIVRCAVTHGDFELAQASLHLSDPKNSMHPSFWDVQEKSQLMTTLIDVACRETVPWHSSTKLLEDALNVGCRLDAEIPGLQSAQPIHMIFEKHQEPLFLWAVRQSFNPNVKDIHGRTCLHHLLISGFSSMDRLKMLLDLGALPHAPDKDGVSAVHIAVQNNCGEELQEMLQRDPRVESDASGDTVFHYIARNGHVDLINPLKAFISSNINSRNRDGRTPLLVAAALGTQLTMKRLLALGANPSLCDATGKSWLHLAGAAGNLGTVAAILALQKDRMASTLSLCDYAGNTALETTCLSFGDGNRDMRMICCQQLLASGSGPEVALHIAVEKGDPQLVSKILEYNPRPQYECASLGVAWLNTTSLSKAAFFQDQTILELLLAAGDSSILDSHGRSCLDYAVLGKSESLNRRRSLPVSDFHKFLMTLDKILANHQPPEANIGFLAFRIAILTNQLFSPELCDYFLDSQLFPKIAHFKDPYGHNSLQLAAATGKYKSYLIRQMLRGIMGNAVDHVLMTEVQLDVVNNDLLCRLLSRDVDAFYSTRNCGSAMTLFDSSPNVSERRYLTALGILHKNKTLGQTTFLEQSLSDHLAKAACKSVRGDHRPTESGFDLWVQHGPISYNLWSDFIGGETCQMFVDLLHAAGEPLFYSKYLPDQKIQRFAILEALDTKHPNIPLAICLLKLHADQLKKSRSKRIRNYLNVQLKEVSEPTVQEHVDCISLVWKIAWEQLHWELVEGFVRLGLNYDHFKPTQHEIKSLFEYSARNNRIPLMEMLAGEKVRIKPYVISPQDSLSNNILRSWPMSNTIQYVPWIRTANDLWKQCTTFNNHFHACFPNFAMYAEIDLYETAEENIVERVQTHMIAAPLDFSVYQSVERLRFLRALLEELVYVFVDASSKSKLEVSNLLDSTLRLGANEEKKPMPSGPRSDYEPQTEGARQGFGVWVAHSPSEDLKRGLRGNKAKYMPGMLFCPLVRWRPMVSKHVLPCSKKMHDAIHLHDKDKKIVSIDCSHFDQENSCLRWTDRGFS